MSELQLKLHRYSPPLPSSSSILSLSASSNQHHLLVSRQSGILELVHLPSLTQKAVTHIPLLTVAITDTAQYGDIYAATSNGEIHQLDTHTLHKRHTLHTANGAVWALEINNTQTILAAATETGRIILYSINTKQEEMIMETLSIHAEQTPCFEYSSSFTTINKRAISIAFDKTDKIIATGSIDGHIRTYTSSGQPIDKISLQNEKGVIIWVLQYLPDNRLLAADSTGTAHIFTDGQLEITRKTHKADILTAAADEHNIYLSGVDHKTVEFNLGTSMRTHSHDVRASLLYQNQLITGGVDSNLHIVQKADFGKTRKTKRISQNGSAQILDNGKWVISCRNNQLWIQELQSGGIFHLLTGLSMGPEAHVASFACSESLKLLAVSDSQKVRLLTLVKKGSQILPKRVSKFPSSSYPAANILKFINDRLLVLVGMDSVVYIIDLEDGYRCIAKNDLHDVGLMSISLSKGRSHLLGLDLDGNLTLMNLTTFRTNLCTLTEDLSSMRLVEFSQQSDDLLIGVDANSMLHQFRIDTASGDLVRIAWTPDPSLFKRFRKASAIIGVLYSSDNCIWVWGRKFVGFVQPDKKVGLKRTMNGKATEKHCGKIIMNSHNIWGVCMSEDGLTVAESPEEDSAASDPFYVKKYGI